MAIVRLRHVDDQSMTGCQDPHASTVTLYTFLRSSPSTADRAMAMREFHRHASRHEERGTTVGGALLRRGNTSMVMLCEEAVHDVLLRSQVVAARGGGRASTMMQERNPTLALERHFWRHFLTHPAPRSASSQRHASPAGNHLQTSPQPPGDTTTTRKRTAVHHSTCEASLDGGSATTYPSVGDDATELSHETVRVGGDVRRPPLTYDEDAATRDERRDEGNENGEDGMNDSAIVDASSAASKETPSPPPQLLSTQRPSASPREQRHELQVIHTHAASPILAGSPVNKSGRAMDQQQAYASPPSNRGHALKELPRQISLTLRDVLDRFRSESSNRNVEDAQEVEHATSVANRIVALRTRLQAEVNATPTTTTSSSSQRIAFLQQLLDRVHNAETAHEVLQQEQDTANVTANALRLENAALTKTLRSLLAIMTTAEVRLARAAPGKLPREEVLLLSSLQDVLDEASNSPSVA